MRAWVIWDNATLGPTKANACLWAHHLHLLYGPLVSAENCDLRPTTALNGAVDGIGSWTANRRPIDSGWLTSDPTHPYIHALACGEWMLDATKPGEHASTSEQALACR